MKVLPVLLLFTALSALAQDKVKSIPLNDPLLYTAIDRTADFYVVTGSGQIQRFNPDGKLTLLFKAPEPPTVFDPRDGARIFAYYRSDQHYEYLSPSFRTISSYKIDPSFAIQPWLICPSGDHKIWILDKADHTLKKINVRDSEVEVEVVVDSATTGRAQSFTSMREYQNFVFLLDPSKGIHVFNSLGNHVRSIESHGIRSFNFLGEELYYLQNGRVHFFNLFTADTRNMSVSPHYSDALVTDERLILFGAERIDIFAFRP